MIAPRRIPDVQPVDHQAPFVVAPAVDWKLRRRRCGDDVVQIGGDAGHDRDHRVVAADRGEGLEDVIVQRQFPPCALNVDDRALTGDRHRFRDGADLELDSDRRHERSGQLDAFAPQGRESRQGERHRVGAGSKVFDAVLTRAVGDRRPDSLDQLGAGRLHSDAGEHGAGGIFDRSGNDCLRERDGRHHRDARRQDQGPHHCVHLSTSHSSNADVRSLLRRGFLNRILAR